MRYAPALTERSDWQVEANGRRYCCRLRVVYVEAERRMGFVLRAFSQWRGLVGPRGGFPVVHDAAARSFLPWLPQFRTITLLTRVSTDPCGSFRAAQNGSLAPWCYQQVRSKARGNEYQPSNIKRKRKHGWIRRLSTPGGIQVILRRMLKGRKSLSH
ncbi:39S ribosomal protein L34, mitochondrial [Dromiciops gliroides]|uniref:39S ribosomal protein L34, mitochondrial n=1 Tax=Dromiciops gliroides TaxID=33562 RepID=UPI001CC3B800|nr:39S ribosomal protein L34, mitochondrial [Dromiciops gliroides]